jgi:hypothetical protein
MAKKSKRPAGAYASNPPPGNPNDDNGREHIIPLPSASVSMAGVDLPAPTLDEALAAFGLTPAHVAGSREQGGKIRILTRGGQKLTYPDDVGRTLTESEKDGACRTTEHLDTPWNKAQAELAKKRKG